MSEADSRHGGVLPFDGVRPSLGARVFVAPGAQVIGDVEIGDDSGIWYNCVLRGDVNEIRIGARVNIQDGTVIHVATHGQGAYIGDEVSVGHMALLHACTIEAGGFVGMKAVVMDGARVEGGAMVAAGALVTPGKVVKRGELWAGWPAKPKRALTDEDLEMMRWTRTHYADLAKKHAESLT
ncbi:MAG: gamma carbonic anhydrase family protein [Alphaproteobacteria bacterium]|nr:gamma carbonic anhydrase family protein [Alphaproteobacteria bacterium]